MYPRNAASPPRIAIGAVVQISDGAVQTSGCTVRILEQGGAEGDGAGTTAYSTDGVVLYTPTQAETDQIGFILIAKKTGCIPVSQTIITSASDVTGYAGVDWSKVNAPTSTQGLSGTTIKTATDVETDTADIQSRLPAALTAGGNIKADVDSVKTQTVTCAAGVTVLASVGTAATSTAQTGDAFARLGAPAGASVSADVAAVKSDTAAILVDTGTDGVVVAAGSKTGYSLTSAYDFAKGTTAMTEAYAANGAAPTPVEAIFAIHQYLMQFGISSTNYTVKKLDNSTTAFTVTLDDATTPSAAART